MEKELKKESLKAYEKLAALFGTTPEEIYQKSNKSKTTATELLKEDLEKVLSCLNQKELDVLKLRYGMIDGGKRTLEEVGELYGVNRDRICQVETNALCKLKNFINKKDSMSESDIGAN